MNLLPEQHDSKVSAKSPWLKAFLLGTLEGITFPINLLKGIANFVQETRLSESFGVKRTLLTLVLYFAQVIVRKFKQLWQFKINRYRMAALVDFCLILFILGSAAKPVQRLISPFLSGAALQQLNPFSAMKNVHETFAFAPGSSPRNLNRIDFTNLNTLAFYDVPVDPHGYLYTNSDGYGDLVASSDLVQRAHDHGTKVLITFSQNNPDTIKGFLDDPQAPSNFAQNALDLVRSTSSDGVTIDFETNQNLGPTYRAKFSQFMNNLTYTFHLISPGKTVAIALGDFAKSNFYDLKALGANTDKTLIIASDFAVPENNTVGMSNPTYGYSSNTYWNDVAGQIKPLTQAIPSSKLALERAWYGNGEQYPMYVPNSRSDTPLKQSSLNVLDQQTIDKLVDGVPDSAKPAARRNIPYIAKALDEEGILNDRVLSYALATIEHETAGTFEPLEEFYGRQSARRLGYEGGTNFFGRGFIQLTHLRNYRLVGERIGMGEELARHPELASTPEVAAKILAAFFKDNNIANLASAGDFIEARYPVNPDQNAYSVAMMAQKYEQEQY